MSLESSKTQSNSSVEKINQLINNETDIKIYKKLNFLKLKAEGYSTKEAYELANLKKSIAYLTLDQWEEGGYERLLRKKGGERTPKLNTEQLMELKTHITINKTLSESDIQKFIKNKWQEEYTPAGIRNLLKTQFNITLNENKHTINELTSQLQPYLKKLENIDEKQNDELNKLKLLISRETNAEIFKKLSYLLLRTLGFSNKFTSELFSITTATGKNWFNNWNSSGYDGLKRKKGQGRKSKLTNDEIKTLKKN